jgi:dTDP-4-amino-4,6-dideoxygalactose transaminase
MDLIPFNKPYLTGKETLYIEQAVKSGKISGNGMFTQMCHSYFEQKYGFKRCLLTTSCTDALEMCAMLLNIEPGDEVIMPSFTFVSTALAFVRQGAKIVFADSKSDHPNINVNKIEELITPATKAIVVVHYAGIACEMNRIMDIADRHGLFVVEDAAHSVDSYYITNDGRRKPLGSIGHLSAFSFHETKNIQCGEGGMLAINDAKFVKRAEIIWEKGTNRAEFFRGEINKYGWVDIGSSFLPSEVVAAFLWAQIENLDDIQKTRINHWNNYNDRLKELTFDLNFNLPFIPDYATNNAHMYYLIFNNHEDRALFISEMNKRGIITVFHYLSLHKSHFYESKHDGRILPESDRYSDCLVRLPMFYELKPEIIDQIIEDIKSIKYNKPD